MIRKFIFILIFCVSTYSQTISSINQKLGSKYVWGAESGRTYDCSGLVWSVFKEDGKYFPRSRAKDYWKMFSPVIPGNEYQFGNLVFFNNLKHVGIVIDKERFVHASRSKGVVIDEFDKYGRGKIYGFRKVN